MTCKKCGAPLHPDEAALHCKLINRGSAEFFCLDCLSEYTKIPIPRLRELIDYYRKQGCALFN